MSKANNKGNIKEKNGQYESSDLSSTPFHPPPTQGKHCEIYMYVGMCRERKGNDTVEPPPLFEYKLKRSYSYSSLLPTTHTPHTHKGQLLLLDNNTNKRTHTDTRLFIFRAHVIFVFNNFWFLRFEFKNFRTHTHVGVFVPFWLILFCNFAHTKLQFAWNKAARNSSTNKNKEYC